MILDEIEIKERFESPANLLNRLKSQLSKSNSHNSNNNMIPSIPPSSDQIIEDLEDKLKHGGLKSKAAAIMDTCLDELKGRIPDIQKPEKLAAIAAEMNKVIIAEDKNRNSDRSDAPQIIIYSPEFINEEHFETIYVRE